MPSSFYMTPSEILLGTIKIWSIFWTKFHSKICKSWYYCFNYITSKSATRHNRFAIFILYDSFRNFIRNNKNMVNILNKISLKNMQIVILLLSITSRLNQELDITGLPSSFYMTPSEILLGTIKIWSIFWTKFHSKICKSWYYCFNYTTSKSGTRHNRFAFFILYDSFRNFIRNNKNMVNILNKISLKNMQIVILLLQLHHV